MWEKCPVCGQPDMRSVQVSTCRMIYCTNLACASNGGQNYDALHARVRERAAPHLQRILEAHRRYENAGHGPTSLQRLGELLEVIAQVELAQ